MSEQQITEPLTLLAGQPQRGQREGLRDERGLVGERRHHYSAAGFASAAAGFRVQLAGEVIDLFKHLTGTGQHEPDTGIVNRALRDMAAVR